MANHAKFRPGMEVEVRREEAELEGFWYPAKILDEQDRVYVQYDTLISEADESKQLKEFVKLSNVRFRPPEENPIDFQLGDSWLEDKFEGLVVVGESHKFFVSSRSLQEKVWCEEMNRWFSWYWIKKISPDFRETSGETSEVMSPIGRLVEVSGDEDGFSGAWFTAIIVAPARMNNFIVAYLYSNTGYETVHLIKTVASERIRPFPPEVSVETFSLYDEVDAWRNDGYFVGFISRILEGPKYVVYFPNTYEKDTFKPDNLRFHQEWINNKWIHAAQDFGETFGETSFPVEFPIGMLVEVSGDEDGFSGAWFTANIVTAAGKNSFVVDYLYLNTGDETEPLMKTVASERIRPFPPEVSVETFSLYDEVDAWRNDGYFVGFISRILEGPKYVVYFPNTYEKDTFEPDYLRFHQEWINNEWIHAAQISVGNLEMKYPNGMLVEVLGVDELYLGAWFTATIVDACGDNSFVAEFRHWKTDGGSKLLKAFVDSEHIRPFPPPLPVNTFSLHEQVDAWQRAGWWEGLISSILQGPKYIVSFPKTNDRNAFKPCHLRVIRNGSIASG